MPTRPARVWQSAGACAGGSDGVSRAAIRVHGYGESNPPAKIVRGVRKPQNQRVEITLN